MEAKRWVYWVNESQDPAEHGGYVPSIVKEDEPGHSPLTGRGEHSAPWVWGKTWEAAQKVASELNRKRGISEDEEFRIIASSMFHAGRHAK